MSNLPSDLIFVFYLLWLAVAAVMIWRVGVLRPGPLRRAPQRYSRLEWWHLGAIFLLYAAGAIVASGVLLAAVPAPPPPATMPAPATPGVLVPSVPAVTRPALPTTAYAAATAPAAASATVPATMAAAAPATTTAAAPARVDGLTPRQFALSQVSDMAAKALGIGAILLLASRLVSGGLEGFGIAPRQLPRGLVLGGAAMLLLMPWLAGLENVSAFIGEAIRHGPVPVHPILQELEGPLSPRLAVVLVLSACVVAPIGEEMFFRGVLQTMLLRGVRRRAAMRQSLPARQDAAPLLEYAGPATPGAASARARWAVIVVVSLLFAAVHLPGAQQSYEALPVLFLLALGLGYVYERTGNLWASITMHAIFNSLSVALVLSGAAGS